MSVTLKKEWLGESGYCNCLKMKGNLHNVIERIKSLRDGRHDTVYELSWDESAVGLHWRTMENETGSLSFQWCSVSAVDTYKRDYFQVDCICLAFETPTGWIEVNEDMKGWGEFLKAVESCLAGFPSQGQWWNKVRLPPFATNHSRLWTKSGQNQSAHTTA